MIKQTVQEVYHDIEDAIIHDAHTGFREDYLVLHSLLRRHRPNSYFEVGTNIAAGLNVAMNAIYKYNFEAKIYSLDLPYETMKQKSEQYPIGENGEDRVGSAAKFPYIQLRGDSLHFLYEDYPCEGYFVDGEHDESHVLHETIHILKTKPKIVVYHDSDLLPVLNGILIAIYKQPYEIYRVTDTRISYLLPK